MITHNGTLYAIADPGVEWELRVNVLNPTQGQSYQVRCAGSSSSCRCSSRLSANVRIISVFRALRPVYYMCFFDVVLSLNKKLKPDELYLLNGKCRPG
jgi:hypothetical protein